MIKNISIAFPQVFGFKKQEQRSAQLIKSQVRPLRKNSAQPFMFYAASVLVVLNGLVFFSYLFGVNAAASSGYEIKKLQQQVSGFTEENKKLNLKISEHASIAELQTDFANSGFVPVGQVIYVTTPHYSQK